MRTRLLRKDLIRYAMISPRFHVLTENPLGLPEGLKSLSGIAVGCKIVHWCGRDWPMQGRAKWRWIGSTIAGRVVSLTSKRTDRVYNYPVISAGAAGVIRVSSSEEETSKKTCSLP